MTKRPENFQSFASLPAELKSEFIELEDGFVKSSVWPEEQAAEWVEEVKHKISQLLDGNSRYFTSSDYFIKEACYMETSRTFIEDVGSFLVLNSAVDKLGIIQNAPRLDLQSAKPWLPVFSSEEAAMITDSDFGELARLATNLSLPWQVVLNVLERYRSNIRHPVDRLSDFPCSKIKVVAIQYDENETVDAAWFNQFALDYYSGSDYRTLQFV